MGFDAGRWDQKYGGADFFYGTEPNDFLREHAARLPPGGRVLSLGEGEGRNAVFLAALGLEVTALDASSVGLAKAGRLAADRGVRLRTQLASLEDYAFEAGAWDAIVSIWCHLPPPLRRRVHASIATALRPGGVFLLEAYTPGQLALGTGGPREAELLLTAAELRAEIGPLEPEHLGELEREVHEGTGHRGRSAVVQLLARRPAAPGR
ncbi:MAG: class I SAM-dependent methyltransferase [Proteobacteria bacterium]|nr:class I SAM-dependent methyltransferase [Pseudomonadota bacterium]